MLKDSRNLDYEKIGAGPFAISTEVKSFPLEDLREEFLVLGKNTRPDSSLYDVKIHLGLKGTDQTMKVVEGQTLFLAFTPDNHLKFEETPTPLWIKPHLERGQQIQCELGVKLVDGTSQVLLEEKRKFTLQEKTSAEKSEEESLKILMQSFECAKWWGPDRLFEAYGGATYEKLKNLERIEFESNKEPWVLHIKQGDFYVWEGGRLHRKEAGPQSKGRPLAYVRLVNPYKIEWDVWDESGLKMVHVGHSRERVQSLNVRIEDVFSRIRQRTASRVSCRISNKAAILKKGDWLLKTKSGWRVLKNLREVEDVLDFKAKGELFVFDGLEKSNGNSIFSGKLFDSTRTQMQSVKLPLAQQKPPEHSPHTKKAISTKIRPSSPEEDSTETPRERRSRKKTLKPEELDPVSGY